MGWGVTCGSPRQAADLKPAGPSPVGRRAPPLARRLPLCRREPFLCIRTGLRDLTTFEPESMSLPLDVARIRAEFPSFRQAELKDFAYFENAGGSFTSADVLNRMRNFYWN